MPASRVSESGSVVDQAHSTDEGHQLTVTLTIMDTATIFTGPDTVYRYDLPGTGIQEGWATRAVVDQLRNLAPTQWPEIEVIVDASPEVTDIMVATLVNQGVVAYPHAVAAGATADAAPEPGARLRSLVRSREDTGTGDGEISAARRWLPRLAVAAAAAVVLGGAIWTIVTTTGDKPGQQAQTVPSKTQNTRASTAAPSVPVQSSASGATQPTQPPPPQEHVVGGMRVETPPGFTVEERPGTWLLTGPDDTLRIHVSADPIYTVSPETVLKEAVATIDSDPELEITSAPEGPLYEGTRVHYAEHPGDGSVVEWQTWVERGHLMAMGCHTRHEPTIPNKAACRLAAETLIFLG